MEPMFRIKCNVGYLNYLYWSGVTWTQNMLSAQIFDTEKAAQKELKDLSPPRFYDPKGPGPEVFCM